MTDIRAAIPFDEALPAVQELMVRTLRRSDPVLQDVMTLLTLNGGKNVRARLLLAAAADASGQVPEEAVIAAAALELLHLATLVHDDIIDEAPTRRGQPSVQSRFGRKTAVLSGDYLFCVCFTMIAAISARYPDKFRDFADAMTRICVGELRQNRHNGDTELSFFAYLRTIGGKTAALFSLAMYAGGILGGSPEPEARQLGHIGLEIGLLFQLADDCLDYEAAAETIRKSVKHDLREGVITLPLILAFAADPALKDRVRGQTLAPEDIEAIAAAVVRLGGVAGTWRLAERCAVKAQRRIDRLADPVKRERLTDILVQMRKRNS